jgi:hypothetical protein
MWAVSVDREVIIERSSAHDAETLHHREAGPVDDREILIAP